MENYLSTKEYTSSYEAAQSMTSKDTPVFHTKGVNVGAAKSITSYQYHDQQRLISLKKSKISTVNEAFLYTNDPCILSKLDCRSFNNYNVTACYERDRTTQ